MIQSRVQKVTIIGRRGPLHVAFTLKEIRELARLEAKYPSFDLLSFYPKDVFFKTIAHTDEQIRQFIQSKEILTYFYIV